MKFVPLNEFPWLICLISEELNIYVFLAITDYPLMGAVARRF